MTNRLFLIIECSFIVLNVEIYKLPENEKTDKTYIRIY